MFVLFVLLAGREISLEIFFIGRERGFALGVPFLILQNLL